MKLKILKISNRPSWVSLFISFGIIFGVIWVLKLQLPQRFSLRRVCGICLTALSILLFFYVCFFCILGLLVLFLPFGFCGDDICYFRKKKNGNQT